MDKKIALKRAPKGAGYDYVTPDGRFTVTRKTGGMPRLWWHLQDRVTGPRRGPWEDCATLAEAREAIEDEYRAG